MVTRHATILCLILAVAWAGCVDGDVVEDPSATDVPRPAGPRVSDTEGAIEGAVVDTSLFPVANASVILETTDAAEKTVANATTGEDGAFAFGALEPGTYRVSASHPRFQAASAFVQVTAGKVATASISLTDRPAAVPYIDLKIHGGVVRCDSAALIFFFVVLGGACPITEGSGGVHLEVEDTWRYGVWEIDWDSDTEWLGWEITPATFTCDTEPCYGVGLGPAPGRLEAAPGQTMQDDEYLWSILAYPEGAWEADIYAYYGGVLGDQTTTAFNTTGACPYRCYGVGATLELRFNFYLSVFHHQTLADPSLYTAVPDA